MAKYFMVSLWAFSFLSCCLHSLMVKSLVVKRINTLQNIRLSANEYSSDSIVERITSWSLDTSSPTRFIESINTLRSNGQIVKWNSTLMQITPIPKSDLQFISRTSFSSDDYFGDIVNGAKKSQSTGLLETPFILATAASFLFGAIVVPQIPLPDAAKNAIGLATLFAPFGLLLLSILAPGLLLALQKSYSKSSTYAQEERILYHEAGHFLLGYICGVPVTSYDITGDRDAGTTIELPSEPSAEASLRVVREKAGNLLIVSMAGMVAETLRFGDSKGGAEDLPFAYEILRLSRVAPEDRTGCLRWAVLKALTLLRIHRDALDSVAEAMKQGKPIAECIVAIESEANP